MNWHFLSSLLDMLNVAFLPILVCTLVTYSGLLILVPQMGQQAHAVESLIKQNPSPFVRALVLIESLLVL